MCSKMQSGSYTWNAFLVIRNEENHIRSVIDAIKAQDPPASRILVANDGSTDGTKEILDSISGIEITHHDPYPHDYLSGRFFELRQSLFNEAIVGGGTDYVICVDGDTVLSNSYIGEITKRMRRDGVVIACGQDLQDKLILVGESGAIVDVKWLKKFQHPSRTSHLNGASLITHASLTGFRSAVYTDIPMQFKRNIGTNYNRQTIERRGKLFKQRGFSLWFVILVTIRRWNLHYIKGYLSSGVECKDDQVASWNKRYQKEKVLGRLGMKRSLLRNTDTAIYVESAIIS